MEYQKLGKSGLKVSAISLGSWRTFGQTVDDETTRACMETAYDQGINFFDGGEAYGNGAAEIAMGKVLRATKWPRDTYILSGKVIYISNEWPTQRGLSKKHLTEACDATLKRYGVDYLDLFYCHRPDADTPLEETCRTMHELILRGKILYWGTSMFQAADLLEIHTICERYGLTPPTMEQSKHNMLFRERVEGALVPLYEKYQLGTTIHSPLSVGLLTGKYNNSIPSGSALNSENTGPAVKAALNEENLKKVRSLSVIADELEIPMAHLALAWTLKNPNVSTAIIGGTKPEQIKQNAEATDAIPKLTDEIMTRIEEILTAE